MVVEFLIQSIATFFTCSLKFTDGHLIGNEIGSVDKKVCRFFELICICL